jgi:hypothetical protein
LSEVPAGRAGHLQRGKSRRVERGEVEVKVKVEVERSPDGSSGAFAAWQVPAGRAGHLQRGKSRQVERGRLRLRNKNAKCGSAPAFGIFRRIYVRSFNF